MFGAIHPINLHPKNVSKQGPIEKPFFIKTLKPTDLPQQNYETIMDIEILKTTPGHMNMYK